MTTENQAPAATTTQVDTAAVAATTTAPAATTTAPATTLATDSGAAATEAARVATEAAAKTEAERVAALTPEQREAETTAKAKSEQEATIKAEETRRAALTPEARKVEDDAKIAADAKAKAEAVPEKYEFVTPEGVKADEAITAEFSALAKELGLSQEKAQKVYDIGVKNSQNAATAMKTQVADTQASWLAASKADKEIGGDDKAMAEKMAVAGLAMEFATPELKTVLIETKLGDHPEIVRWMYRVGMKMSEDKARGGRENKTTANTFAAKAQAMYPNMNP